MGSGYVIAVAVVERADMWWQIVRSDWTSIRDAASGGGIGGTVRHAANPPGDENGTAIGGAIGFAHGVFEAVP